MPSPEAVPPPIPPAPPPTAPPAGAVGGAFEDYPLTRPEYISAMVHFYRGELVRANTWRIRLDTSTNWAILSAMGLLSYAFGAPDHSHASLIIGMILVLNFLSLEARRYRFFDVWRHRVRMIEQNFFEPLLTRDLQSPERNWGNLVAGDLLQPTFKISYLQALRARFVRNYASIYGLLLAAWIVKLLLHAEPGVGRPLERLAVGPIPWYVPLAVVGGLYLYLVSVVLLVPKIVPSESAGAGTEVPDF